MKIFNDNFTIEDYIAQFFYIPEPVEKPCWIKEYNDMIVHTRGEKATDLLNRRRPNEEQKILDYRLAVYEPITTPSIKKAVDSLYRTFNNQSAIIKCSDQLQEYIDNTDFYELSLKQFVNKLVLQYDLDDPNGVLLVLPEGEGIHDQSVKVNPIIELYNCSNIKHKFDDLICVLSYEKSEVEINDKTVLEGDVYYILTETQFIKLIQYGIKKDELFRAELVYNHNIGTVPFITLGGDIKDRNVLESFFAGFKYFGNIAIRQFSDLDATLVQTAFPVIEELAAKCPNVDCHDGIVWDEKKQKKKPCHVCNGTGHYIPTNPYTARVREAPSNVEMDTNAIQLLSIPSRKFLHPDVSILEFQFKAWREFLKMGEEALHLNYINEAQSGTAKEIDREDKYSMILKISDNLYDNILFNLLWFMEHYLNPIEPQPVTVIKPTTFDLKSEQDIMIELGEMQSKEMPQLLIAEATKELIKKRFQDNSVSNKIFEVLNFLDPLFLYTNAQKERMLMANIISKSQFITSVYAYHEIIKYISEVSEQAFKDAKTMSIVEALKPRFLQYETQEMPIIENTPDNNQTDDKEDDTEDQE